MSYIEFKNVCKEFENQSIFSNFNFQVNKGDFVTLLGPSGCGKSTLLRCLAGFEPISSGHIFLDGVDITKKKPQERNIGMIFQQYSLFPTMTVYENIAFGLKMQKYSKKVAQEHIEDIITMVDLQGNEKKYPSQLSGGQQQRVALARSLVTRPKVLLLDEPFSAIDAKLRKSLQHKLRTIHKNLGMTSIFVTHDQDEAMILSDVIHVTNKGTIEQSGTALELYNTPKSHFVASFIGNNNILTQEEYFTLSNEHCAQKHIIIRPETLELSHTPCQDTNAFCHKGRIISCRYQGNIIHYHVNIQGIQISVEKLSESSNVFHENECVYVSIHKNTLNYVD